MLGERLGDCKDQAARPQSGGARTRGERGFEIGKLCDRRCAVALRDGLERPIGARAQTEPATDAAKLDDAEYPAENAAMSCERCNGCA